MKKLLFIFVPILLAFIIFIIIFILVNQSSSKGALQVTSLPTTKVYLDGKFIGQSPLCKCEANDMLRIGAHTVRLVPIEGNFDAFEEKITISPSVLTVVDRTFGQGASSQGSVISLSALSDKKESEIVVVSFPDKAQVFLDNSPVGVSPFFTKGLTTSDHELKLTKAGYKDKTLRIRTVPGYKLETLIYLAVNLNAATASAIPSSSPSSTQPAIQSVKILILDTPTGFLRVRDSASLSGKEIAQVKPGEKYDFLSEQTGWFEIKLNDGKTGFISSQYSQKTN